MVTTNPTDLIPRNTVTTMCAAYAQACADVREAARLMAKAEESVVREFGQYSFCTDGLDAEHIITDVRRRCWAHIANRVELKKYLSIDDATTLDREIEKGTVPELTEAVIFDWLNKTRQDIPAMLERALVEVFKVLTPQSYRAQDYKTNQRNHATIEGDKIILTWMIDTTWTPNYPRGVHIGYGKQRQTIQAIDNVFHLLDGQGTADDDTSLVLAMETAMHAEQTTAETPYFGAKWFKNGNLHLTLKRRDLVEQLNSRAAGMNLAAHPQ